MVEAVEDPREEGMHFEEHTLLAKLIQLWISVKKASRDELVENSHDKRGEDGEEDVIKGQCPRFEDDFARERVLKRILDTWLALRSTL